jgi:hypothetical protein
VDRDAGGGQAQFFAELEDGVEVGELAVDSGIGTDADEVNRLAVGLGAVTASNRTLFDLSPARQALVMATDS